MLNMDHFKLCLSKNGVKYSCHNYSFLCIVVKTPHDLHHRGDDRLQRETTRSEEASQLQFLINKPPKRCSQ